MFIMAQIPFADLRPLIPDGRGRLQTPNWTVDDPQGFVRGFGKVSPRNASSLGLTGERSFANMDNAIRFPERMQYTGDGWPFALHIIPWFRRLYFDGQMAGRFEFGFLVGEFYEDIIFDLVHDAAIDPAAVAQELLSTNVQINSIDGSKTIRTFANCARALGMAYLSATTSNTGIQRFPINDTFEKEFFVGTPFIHIRVASGRAIAESRDRRYLARQDEPKLFITSARESENRNNVIVQASLRKTGEEEPKERVVRVLFAHLNSLIFAYARLQQVARSFEAATKRELLRMAIKNMIDRLNRFTQIDNNDWDAEFANGLHLFAKAYTGRIDELVIKLEALAAEWNKPTTLERFKTYIKSVNDLIITTSVGKSIDIAAKGGP
jgi:hypothetical protein